MKKERMPRDLQRYLGGYIEEYFLKTDQVITGISLGGIGLIPGKGASLEGASIETEDGWQFVRESKKEKGMKKIIEIQEEIKIGDVILEKGDKIKILDEKNVTKKDFKQLHSSGELLLVQGGIQQPAKKIFDLLESKGSDWINNKMNTKKVSNMDTSSQLGTGFKVTVLHENIHGRDFYIVEDEIDNSLNNQVSWDTLEYFSTVYVKK